MPTIGINARFQGHEAIRGVLDLIRSHFPSFTLSNIDIHDLKNGPGLFVEYHSEGFVDGADIRAERGPPDRRAVLKARLRAPDSQS
jgi:hypothetical protein